MPVSSLTSSVMKWPSAATVDAAVRALAVRLAQRHPALERFGSFGSYARGDRGVGSDADLLAIVSHADLPFAQRPLEFDVGGLAVPADLLVYTQLEWQTALRAGSPFVRRFQAETIWVYGQQAEVGQIAVGGTADARSALRGCS